MEALLFGLFVLFHPNDYDDGDVYAVPLEYSMQVYNEAAQYPNVEPEDALLILIAEHGGKYPYPADSLGKDGEIGLFQVVERERREANDVFGTRYTQEDLYDWRINMRIAVYTVSHIKHKHETTARCQRRVHDGIAIGAGGKLKAKKVEQKHTWHAHYRCGSDSREECATSYRRRLNKRFAKWKKWGPVRAWRALRPALPSWQSPGISWMRTPPQLITYDES